MQRKSFVVIISMAFISIVCFASISLLFINRSRLVRSSQSSSPSSITTDDSISNELAMALPPLSISKVVPKTVKIVDEDGNTYVGEINCDGKKHGYGVYTFLNGQMRYNGSWDNDHMSGFGKMFWTDGHKYFGNWIDSQRSGYGTMIWPSGSRYKGNWVAGMRQGYGVQTWRDGRKNSGEWYNDVFVGNDTQTWRYTTDSLSRDRADKNSIDKTD